MIPDNVEKIIMTKDDYDRNVEQLLFDKLNAEKEIERITNNWNKLKEFINNPMSWYVNLGDTENNPFIKVKIILDKMKEIEEENNEK